jgi:hypothetical protein
MLRVNQLGGCGAGRTGGSAMAVVRSLGLTDGLKLCLDAGDAASYASGQSWLDLSGNGYDFFRGADGSATASDPTFNGTAGRLSGGEYLSFDGGDYFTYDSANETWMHALHKDNALFSSVQWVYSASPTSNNKLWGTRGASGNTGCVLTLGTSNLNFIVQNAGAGVLSQSTAGLPSANAWHFVAMSLDEAAGANGLKLVLDGAVSSLTSTYSSPAAGNASFTLQIGAGGNSNAPVANNTRIAMHLMWQGVALTVEQLAALYQATRRRFSA